LFEGIDNRHIISDARGISSIVAALKMKPALYTTMLRFFRSAAFTVEALYHKLIRLVMVHALVMELNGRIVLPANHIKIAKEGLRMPCIRKWCREPQNSGKPAYREGHTFGIAGIPGKAGERTRSIPVMVETHESVAKTNGQSIVDKMAPV
jgi:hypothetical protein